MLEAMKIAPIDTVLAVPAIRRLVECVPSRDITLVASEKLGPPRGEGWLSRSVIERFQAITSIGLSHADTLGAAPERHHFEGRSGLPGLSYLAAGDPGGHRVLFIHGTPGEAADWTPFLKNVPAGQQRIAIDRPGFGASGPGRPVPALTEQARAVAALLEADNRPAILVGSSYGGPVALTLAVSHPEAVSGVLLVGAAADPERERIHTVQRLAALRAIRRLLPRALSHSNAELLALRGELEALAGRIERISAPVTVLQGLHDTLVPMENATYIARRLIGSERRRVILVDRAGHFLHILFSQLVETVLADLLANTANRGGNHRASVHS